MVPRGVRKVGAIIGGRRTSTASSGAVVRPPCSVIRSSRSPLTIDSTAGGIAARISRYSVCDISADSDTTWARSGGSGAARANRHSSDVRRCVGDLSARAGNGSGLNTPWRRPIEVALEKPQHTLLVLGTRDGVRGTVLRALHDVELFGLPGGLVQAAALGPLDEPIPVGGDDEERARRDA